MIRGPGPRAQHLLNRSSLELSSICILTIWGLVGGEGGDFSCVCGIWRLESSVSSLPLSLSTPVYRPWTLLFQPRSSSQALPVSVPSAEGPGSAFMLAPEALYPLSQRPRPSFNQVKEHHFVTTHTHTLSSYKTEMLYNNFALISFCHSFGNHSSPFLSL